MHIKDAPICLDCKYINRDRMAWPYMCQHIEVAEDRDLVTGNIRTIAASLLFDGHRPSCLWAREGGGPCGRAGALFEPYET